jgi:hypothetical protein
MIFSLIDERWGVSHASATGLDAASSALPLPTRTRTGKESANYFNLNQEGRPSAPRRSHAHAQQSVTSVMVIRSLGLRTAN